MPHLLPAAASAIAQAAPAAAATAAKASVMTSLKSVAFNALTSLAISSALSVFSPTVGAAARTVEFVIDPDGPIPFAAGHIGVPGAMVHKDTFGPDLMYYGIPVVLSGAGPITSILSVKADDYPMAFDANGGATTEPYRQEFFFRSVLGEQPAPMALTVPSGLKKGATLPGWTAAHKLSGKAAFLMVMAENSKGSAFPNGEVKPLVELLGLKGWDPTQDSTYPGGDGPCRLHDASTWVTLTCPILWGLKWALGLWEGPTLKGAPAHDSLTDHQVGGIGARLSGIDVPAFVAASNIAKANAWTVSAYPNTDDDKHQVLETFLQSGGATYAQRAGKISCISRAAPRANLVTISARDTAGPLEIDTAASRIDRINTIRPRFWSPAHRWQMTALDGEITAASYREEDGGRTRSRGVDWPFVSDAKQVGQLAALQIANTREGIAGVIPLKPHLQRIRPGDAFTITEAGFVLNGLKCLCLNTDYDAATGVVRVSFVSETDAKYPFALGQDPTPPVPQVLTPVDPRFVSPPEAGDWTITPRPPAAGGGQLPGFDLSGVVSNETATAIIVETGPSATGPWTQAYQGPPTVTNIPVDGLQPGATYFIAIQYQRNQNYSDRYVYGPFTAPVLDPGPNAPSIANLQGQVTAAFGDIFDVSELLGQARTDIDAQGTEIAAARGGQPNLNSRIVQVNQARIDGDASNAEAISLVQARTANTEADIIDLENALATETGARAQAIQQVMARLRAEGQNLLKNPTGMRGVAEWAGTPNVGVIDGPAGKRFARFFGAGGNGDSFEFFTQDVAFDGSGQPFAWQSKVAVDGPVTAYCYALALNASGAQIGQIWGITVTTNPVDGRIEATGTAPAGTKSIRVHWALKATNAGYVIFWLQKLENGSIPSAWSDEATTQQLTASVTEHSLAIIDLELQQDIAAYEVAANASSGLPAMLRLFSGLGGGYAAVIAPIVALMNSVPGADPLVAMQAIGGEVFFPRPIYVDLSGRRLIMGPGNGWVLWFGPDTINAADATRTNGYFALGTDGKVYYGNTELGSGGSGTAGAAFNRAAMAGSISSSSFTTLASVTFNGRPASGWWDAFVSGLSGSSDGFADNDLEFRVIESGAPTALASGTVTVPAGDATLLSIDLSPSGPWPQTRPAGNLTLLLQARRSGGSGTATFSGGDFNVNYTPAS